jgi:hypothetical protein
MLRRWIVVIEDLVVEHLRIKFEIDKTLVGTPNLCKLEIYNLNESNRNKIKDKYQNIEIYAGYEDNMPLIFKGQIRTVNSVYSGVDWVTIIYAGDGALALETAKVNKTFPAGTNTDTMVGALITELGAVGGVAKGQLEGIKKCLSGKASLLKTLIMSGGVKEWLDILAKNCGFTYSVNDGVIETNTKGTSLKDEPEFIINQKSGMIGSPEITEVGASCTVYLRGELKLARRFKIESISATLNVGNQNYRKVNKTIGENTYMIQSIKHIGDTHSNDWKTEITGIISR